VTLPCWLRRCRPLLALGIAAASGVPCRAAPVPGQLHTTQVSSSCAWAVRAARAERHGLTFWQCAAVFTVVMVLLLGWSKYGSRVDASLYQLVSSLDDALQETSAGSAAASGSVAQAGRGADSGGITSSVPGPVRPQGFLSATGKRGSHVD
jgi:hypothetical protein